MSSYREMIKFLVHNNVSGICINKYDCSLPDQECCMNQCVGNNNCFGAECSVDWQCGYDETCCRGSCAGHCDSLLPLIPGCVGTAVFLVCLFAGVVWLYRRRMRNGQFQRRLLAPQSAAANHVRRSHYGGTLQSYLPRYTPSTTHHQGNQRFGPAQETYSMPTESRNPNQGCHAVPLRGADAMTNDQPPPYSSFEHAAHENKDDRRVRTQMLNTQRTKPSAPSFAD